MVEMVARRLGIGHRVTALHLVPQGVGVEHIPRARHDIGPVAGLVLLQQPEALVLLRQQPADRALDPGLPAPGRHAARAAHVVHRDQPPQGRIDAAEVPEVGVAAFGVDILRDLAIGRLLRDQRLEARHRALLQRVDAAAAHRHRADGGIAPEDAGVAARLRRFGPAGGQDAVRRQVSLQQGQRGVRAVVDQRGRIGDTGHRGPLESRGNQRSISSAARSRAPRPKASARARTTPPSRIRKVCWISPPPMSRWSIASSSTKTMTA